MTTINYDQPVKDLIAGLSATGHVTHTASRKTSVTLHHNDGVANSHEAVLETWKTRPASAHFDVDVSGAIAQYVKVDEIAWGVGDWDGNVSTISIEMADSNSAFVIAPATWLNAARLAAWLFANVIHARPDASNVFPHRHWVSTDCPGPWVMNNWNTILGEIQKQYDAFVGHPAPPPPPASVPTVSLHLVQMCAHEDPAKPQGQTTNSANVTPVQRALVAEGLLHDSDTSWGRGAFGSMTITAYKHWQERLGYTGSDADGIPGMTSLTKLGNKHGFHVVA